MNNSHETTGCLTTVRVAIEVERKRRGKKERKKERKRRRTINLQNVLLPDPCLVTHWPVFLFSAMSSENPFNGYRPPIVPRTTDGFPHHPHKTHICRMPVYGLLGLGFQACPFSSLLYSELSPPCGTHAGAMRLTH